MEIRLRQWSGKPLSCVVDSVHLCAAVIPCFNEAGSIGDLTRNALRSVRAVWVVDDGSSDRTRFEAENAGAAVIRHQVNLGKGASVREGLAAVQAAGYEWAVIMDGDGQHDPAEIMQLKYAAASGADLVIGNRMQNPAAMGGVRRFVNRWMSQRIGKRIGIECPDSQCGFRLVRLDAWAKLRLRQNRFEFESEMLVAFVRAGLKVAFVPVSCRRARRRSRIRPLVDTVRWFRWWLTNR
jgi:glycosyltransferase involved in cell wall biosynthesis